MRKKLVLYFFICLSIYLLLAATEIFILKPAVDMIGFSFRSHLIVYSILFLIINPILTKLISDNLKIIKLSDNHNDKTQI